MLLYQPARMTYQSMLADLCHYWVDRQGFLSCRASAIMFFCRTGSGIGFGGGAGSSKGTATASGPTSLKTPRRALWKPRKALTCERWFAVAIMAPSDGRIPQLALDGRTEDHSLARPRTEGRLTRTVMVWAIFQNPYKISPKIFDGDLSYYYPINLKYTDRIFLPQNNNSRDIILIS